MSRTADRKTIRIILRSKLIKQPKNTSMNIKAKYLLWSAAASTILMNGGCTFAESTSKINCEARGDSVIASNTGEHILEQRLVKYQELEEYGRNMTGARGGQRAKCIIKNDPPGYRWISCTKDQNRFSSYTNGSWNQLIGVEEVIANSVQFRGWSGACKVKL